MSDLEAQGGDLKAPGMTLKSLKGDLETSENLFSKIELRRTQ